MPSFIPLMFSNCPKNYGHEDFISLKDFSPQHLAVVQQNPELYDLIKCQGALTVKIKSLYAKAQKSRGKSSKHTGEKEQSITAPISITTGLVIWVNKRTTGIGQSCQCDQCLLNDKDVAHNDWYELIIVSNTQVISNQYVADSIEIEFSLTEEQQKKVHLKGNCKYVELNEDICQLHFMTCDLELGTEIHFNLVQFENLLSNAFIQISKESAYIFSVAVSCPHGCDKHVSFSFEKDQFHSFDGSHSRNQEMSTNKGIVLWPSIWNHAKVLYNVPTCPGSSGAIVITLTWNKGILISLHQGKIDSFSESFWKEKNLRHVTEFLKEDEEPDRVEDIGPMVHFPSTSKSIGMAEGEACYHPEAHLPLVHVECEKHPEHKKFFHIGELTLDHLPEKHREKDILENIFHTAALTVKVKTGYVSRKRPKVHPHTGDPYIWSEQKGQECPHVGTGFVINVQPEKLKYGQTCQCIECESSDSVRHECYKIIIMTATHVVFDQAEAKRTEIEFSYYQNDKEVATKLLKGKCKHCVVNEDACWLEYSTHDEKLVSKLYESLVKFQKGKLNLSKNKEHDTFVTIVSHPHGSTKQHVSFGNILSDSDILLLKDEDSESVDTTSEEKSSQVTKAPAFQFYHPFEKVAIWPGDLFKPIVCQQIAMVCYTTPTCPGSSGALVCVHKPGVGNIVYTHLGCRDHYKYNRSGGGTVFYINDNQIFPS